MSVPGGWWFIQTNRSAGFRDPIFLWLVVLIVVTLCGSVLMLTCCSDRPVACRAAKRLPGDEAIGCEPGAVRIELLDEQGGYLCCARER